MGIELFLVRPLRPFHGSIQLGRVRRQHEQLAPLRRTRLLELGLKFAPPIHPVRGETAWIALTGNGMRSLKCPRNCLAVPAVARLWASTTSHLETTARAVNCLIITPGRG